ncbi:hypothetical protein M501DRAFT_994668 [Patellaria atrata CBS 101060]|uniref:Small ribosomal subunit protein uS9m n=1 Tax=Patellaria atrata CBS 101060 TaxID=1346257 RepID=A0A9P4SKR8_9PEZI|nr:hypothetical protein M501DRAFT_994668 [Patellaria atrata CBS 101060]
MKASSLSIGFRRATCSFCRLSRQAQYESNGFRSFHPPGVSRRHLATTTTSPVTAAPELNFSKRDGKPIDERLLKRVRIVPASPSYFSGKPVFTDGLLSMQALLRKFQTLPCVEPNDAPRVAWKRFREYLGQVNEPVKAAKYHKIIQILQRLNRIHPSLMPEEVTEAMKRYKRDVNPHDNQAKPSFVDENGVSRGLGRRKTSTARVWLVEGEGEVLVNGKTLTQTFGKLHDRESAIWALKATNRTDKYNVWALVSGGGTTGQAEALTLAIAKALLVQEPLLKPALRRAGCVTRDPRIVERKKPGHLKARKMPTWVKR